jgi:hypothetical protein
MKTLLLIIVTLLSIVPSAVSQDNSQERTIVMKDNLQTISIYCKVRKMVKMAYLRIENQLIRNDEENFVKIKKYINGLLMDSKKRTDINAIESYVSYVGSSQYINEYKGLFVDMYHLNNTFVGTPDEVMYILDKNDRIVYFEARNLFKDGDKQVFDRELLRKFKVTKSQIKALYKYSF